MGEESHQREGGIGCTRKEVGCEASKWEVGGEGRGTRRRQVRGRGTLKKKRSFQSEYKKESSLNEMPGN